MPKTRRARAGRKTLLSVLAFTVHWDRYNVTLEAMEEGRVDESRIAALGLCRVVTT
jgi:hypothetical protein